MARSLSIYSITAINILLSDVGELLAAVNFEKDAKNDQGIATTLGDNTEEDGNHQIVDGLFNDVLLTTTNIDVQPPRPQRTPPHLLPRSIPFLHLRPNPHLFSFPNPRLRHHPIHLHPPPYAQSSIYQT